MFQTTVTAVRLQNISATPGIPAGFHFLDSRSERDGGKLEYTGGVTPAVIGPTMVANLGHGELASPGSVEFPATCRLMANDRPLR